MLVLVRTRTGTRMRVDSFLTSYVLPGMSYAVLGRVDCGLPCDVLLLYACRLLNQNGKIVRSKERYILLGNLAMDAERVCDDCAALKKKFERLSGTFRLDALRRLAITSPSIRSGSSSTASLPQ